MARPLKKITFLRPVAFPKIQWINNYDFKAGETSPSFPGRENFSGPSERISNFKVENFSLKLEHKKKFDIYLCILPDFFFLCKIWWWNPNSKLQHTIYCLIQHKNIYIFLKYINIYIFEIYRAIFYVFLQTKISIFKKSNDLLLAVKFKNHTFS